MVIYDDIYEIAADNYGIVTSEQAKGVGASDKELSRIAKDGRLTRIGYGVYRIKHWVPTGYDAYADSVALVGPDAYLYGESVIALLNLVPTNPTYFYVAQPGRSRKVLPKEIVLRTAAPGYTPTFIQGIRCQQVGDAILSARGTVPPDRLVAAAREAYRTGHLDKEEMESVIREMEAST